MKSEIRRHGTGWVARYNPGSGMWTHARWSAGWQEAIDWLCTEWKRLGPPQEVSDDY